VNERIMCLKVLVCDQLVTCICAYAPQTGRSAEEFLGSDAQCDRKHTGHVFKNILCT